MFLAFLNEGAEKRHGCIVGHETVSVGIVDALAEVLDNGGFGMKLHTDGAVFVCAINTLNHADARYGSGGCYPQRGAFGVEQGLMVP